MKAGRVSRRVARAAREDRHGVAQHEYARSGNVPHPACRASPHRQQVVHLSDVRLRARPVGFDRKSYALHVHARIRRPPADLQLVHRAVGNFSVAADRVRPPQPDLHAAEQAQTAATGRERHGARLGRSPHADAVRHSPPRLHAGSDPQFLRGDRRLEDQRHHRAGHARTFRARRPEQDALCA